LKTTRNEINFPAHGLHIAAWGLRAASALFIITAVSAPLALAQNPTLTSAVPGESIQGGEEIEMTLVGTNFRPGITVVISPTLQSLQQSKGNQQSLDITVLNTTRVNANTLTARISIGTHASPGLRAIDVLNTDGTNTGSNSGVQGTSKPFHVYPSNSIAAPLTIINLGLITPRDGTVASQDGPLYAEAILNGSGTGTVLGQWLWDGSVFEEFTAELSGGTSTTLTTKQSLPTQIVGAHQLQIRMTQPNKLAAIPVTIVVNPAGQSREQLLYPLYARGFDSATPPYFLWAPVPGATRYQVGFSTTPYNSNIKEWFDVEDNRWQISAEAWKSLPTGLFYWTVRAIDSNGIARQPLPLRPIARNIEGGLHALKSTTRTAEGHTLLEWKPIQADGYYFVTISSDADANNIIRQYLTRDSKLDLRAIDGKLIPGNTYYFHVDAVSPDGQVQSSGPTESFVVPRSGNGSSKLMTNQPILMASLGKPAIGSNEATLPTLPALVDLASSISSQTPAPGSTTNLAQPAITVAFAAQVDPAYISLSVDSVDVTALAQISLSKLAFAPPMALAGGDHIITLTLGADSASWKFTVVATGSASATQQAAPASQPKTDAEPAPAQTASAMPKGTTGSAHKDAAPAAQPNRPTLQSQLGATTQWASGSNPADSNILSASERMIYQKGHWHIEANGSGLLNSILNPPQLRTSHGQFNDYVFQLGYKNLPTAVNLRFGVISPVLFTDAQFVTVATPRQGVDFTIKSMLGTLGGFTNTNDNSLGGGAGISFHQQIEGASYQPPLPAWAMLRLMWLNATDTGLPTVIDYDAFGNPLPLPSPISPQTSGDVLGGLLKINFTKKWLWSSEYAISYFNPNFNDPTSTREFGRAWRTGISGQINKIKTSFIYREVSPNFGNPANPSITEASQPNLRGANASLTDQSRLGNFGFTYKFLDNNVHPTISDEILLNSFGESWNKTFNKINTLSIESRQTLTKTGAVPAALISAPPSVSGSVDSRDLSVNIKFTHKLSATTYTASASRDWFRDNLTPANNTITSSVHLGANLAEPKSIFHLSAQFNANWVAADGATTGNSSSYTANIQPSLNWKHPTVQFAPMLKFSRARTVLSSGTAINDTLNGQYGGRLSWTLPGIWKFSTFSAQGSYIQNRDYVAATHLDSTQLLLIWTLTWKHKTVF
jgi:hypothetical protein